MNVVKKQSRINWTAGACPLQVDTGEYHVQDFHVCDWLFSYDPLKIPVILASSLKYNIILAKFFEIPLENNVNFSAHAFVDEAKIIR